MSRGNPLAGTARSLGKLLRAELPRFHQYLIANQATANQMKTKDWTWNPVVHPWVFCAFDKTLTAVWHGRKPAPNLPKDQPLLRYRWKDMIPEGLPADPRFHLAGMAQEDIGSVARHALSIRSYRNFEVNSMLGFEFPVMPGSSSSDDQTTSTVVLDSICLRVISATDAQKSIKKFILCVAETRGDPTKNSNVRTESDALIRWLEDLDLSLHLWTNQMLDLAYWMQTDLSVRNSGYVDSYEVDKAANFLLRPDGRRHGWYHGDMPDLTPYLAVSNAFHDREFSAKGGGGGGGGGGSNRTTTANSAADATTKKKASAPKNQSSSSSSASSPSSGPFRGSRALSVLVHVAIRKSLPQRCKGRSLKNMCQRYAVEDPPAGLALMDAVACLYMGGTPGCLHRPRFAVRARIRAQTLIFRGATVTETEAWMQDNAKVLQLAFTEYYLYAVRWDLAFQAVVCDVQLHMEFTRKTRESGDELRAILDTLMTCHDMDQPGAKGRFAGVPQPGALHIIAWSGHDRGLEAFGKARKGAFVTRAATLMKGWLRTFRTSKTVDICEPYKEEMTQMLVLSKMMYCSPECASMIVADIMKIDKEEKEAVKKSVPLPWLVRDAEPGRSSWGLGVPKVNIPIAMIESFRAWEGDNSLFTSPYFADKSFFASAPYQWLDHDTVRAIDLAAWMCARRSDSRFVTSWLRNPIGLSEMAYRRLCLLYFSYEFCDIPDHSIENQFRWFLFRRRRRVICESEYQLRMKLGDPSIKNELTETICCTVGADAMTYSEMLQNTFGEKTNITRKYKPVARRIVEEYGTDQSRRDFAIIYSYIMRVTYYKQWAVLSLPEYVCRHQIEALRRRQTMEPWTKTDVDLLGSQSLCGCGRWTSKAVVPPDWTTTSSVTERRVLPQLAKRTRASTNGLEASRITNLKKLNIPCLLQQQQHAATSGKKPNDPDAPPPLLLQPEYRQAAANVVPTRRQPKKKTGSSTNNLGGGGGASLAYINPGATATPGCLVAALSGAAAIGSAAGRGIVSNMPTSKIDLETVRSKTIYTTALSITTSSRGAVSRLDDTDIRLTTHSKRWNYEDASKLDRMDRSVFPNSGSLRTPVVIRGPPKEQVTASAAAVMPTPLKKKVPQFLLEWSRPMSCDDEAVTRDVHVSKNSRMVGSSNMAMDIESGHMIYKEKNSGTMHPAFCLGTELFRINLIGVAVHSKGPKVSADGDFMTICATCGSPTTLSMERWNHRGPSCGAHGRPHRLPALLKPILETVPPVLIDMAAAAKSDRERLHLDLVMNLSPEEPYVWERVASLLKYEGAQINAEIHRELTKISAKAGFPSPANIPCCWYCGGTTDQIIRAWESLNPEQTQKLNKTDLASDAFLPENINSWNQAYAGMPTVRFRHGTSVASSPMSSTGAAIHARRLVVSGTDQATPIRHINIRCSMFGYEGLDGCLGNQITPGNPNPIKPISEQCARGHCDCNQSHLDCTLNKAEQFNKIGKNYRRHATTIKTKVLPIELLPAVGPEICVRALDDMNTGSTSSTGISKPLQQVCIYLCNVHIKDRRVGWIARRARLEQLDAKLVALNRPNRNTASLVQWDSVSLDAAARDQNIGRTVLMHRMLQKVQLLSDLKNDIRVGVNRRMNDMSRGYRGQYGITSKPEVSRSKQHSKKDGGTFTNRIKGYKSRHKPRVSKNNQRAVKKRRSTKKKEKKLKKKLKKKT